MAGQAGADRERNGEVALAGAGRAEEDDVDRYRRIDAIVDDWRVVRGRRALLRGWCRPPLHLSDRSYAVRFADAELFERLFLRTVALCQQRLLEGSHLSVDGFRAA